jgi:spermidine synthase
VKNFLPVKDFMNLPFLLAFILMGFTFTITQVIVIRELLVVFTGNELSIALILANWLWLEAAGSLLLGKQAKELGLGKGGYALLQASLSALLPLTIYGIRCLRELMGLSLGEGASLWAIFCWTIPVLAPLGIVNGILFALGCRLYAQGAGAEKAASSIGRVYLYEALGAGGGGILYTFLFIPFLTSFQTAFLLGASNLFSGLLLVSTGKEKGTGKKKVLAALLGSGFIASILLLILPGAGRIEKSSLDREWRGLQVLESRWSPYGNVTVGRREEQLTFFSNGMPICNEPFPDIAFVEEMVHYPLLFSPFPRRILIIGGGFGGVIHEVLKQPVEEVHYAEIDPLVIELIKENLTPLTRAEIENPRVHIHNLDGRLFIRTTPRRFDGVLLHLPPPFTLDLNRYYTVEFFREIFGSLNEHGILALSIPGSDTYLSPELRDLNLCLIRSLREVFPSVYVLPGDVNIILASVTREIGPLSPELFIRRLKDREIVTHFLTPFQIRLKLEKQRQEWLEDSLKRGGVVRVNRDANPSGLYYGIAYWNAQFHPFLQIFWGRAQELRLWHLAAALGFLFCGIFALPRKDGRARKKWALTCIVATTGFFGIAYSVLFIFSFQTVYGYAYQWIGLLIASFMVGLALGSWTMTRALEKIRKFALTLAGMEIFMVFFAALGMILLDRLFSSGFPPRILAATRFAFLLLSGIAGYWVGLEFPLAGGILSKNGERVAWTAGILYGSDLFGAWIGSLLVGVLLVPVLGILQTCAVILFLKVASLALIPLISQRRS